MKKILLILISCILAFSLLSCVDNFVKDETVGTIETIENSDGKQVPIYEGMTISSVPESSSKEAYVRTIPLSKSLTVKKELKNFKDVEVNSSDYQADLGEDIFITIHINNPDKFEILSFTLNGEKYSSYMFEYGSDMETIIIKCNVGYESGEHNYTIDAIKYVDKSAIKNVVIHGEQTIKIIVSEYVHVSKCKHDNAEKIITIAGKASTCQQEGLTEGKKCELCNTVFLAQENLPKLECSPSDWIIDREVSVTKDGLKHIECTTCGKRIQEEIIYAVRSQGLAYKVNDDGTTCTITGLGTCTDINIVIPEYIDGYKVTAIGETAFKGCKNITSVAISQYVSEIGARAFMNCEAMEKVILPAALKIVGEEGFYICSSLKNVYYEGDTEGWCGIDFVTGWSSPLGHYSQLYFGDKLVTELVIPDTVTKIDNHAFFGCLSITSVKIGNGVTEIGDQAFSCCKSIVEVTLGNSVKIIDDCAFESTQITEIIIPDSVEYIGCETFYNCKLLKNVVIGKSVEYVHVGAFLNCTSLVYNEYEDCLYLGNEDNPYHVLISIKDNSVTSFEIPTFTKAIIGGAFSNFTSLESVTIPNTVTVIGWHMFQDCTALKNVVIPDSVTSIDEAAFYGCNSLENIIIPNGVISIGNSAFAYCKSLQSINIPASVTNIGSNAFSQCGALKKIVVDANNEYYAAIGNSLFTKDEKTLIRYANDETILTYTIPDGVNCIADNAFSGCTTIVNVTIPNSVTVMGRSAFSACNALESVVIPNTITCIEDFAFYNCTALVNVIIPETVTTIGERAFCGCTSLTSIIIPESVSTIEIWAFRDCTSLTISCVAKYKPNGWNNQWIYNTKSVVWGYLK